MNQIVIEADIVDAKVIDKKGFLFWKQERYVLQLRCCC